MDDVLIAIEESTRSTKEGVKNFVEPAEGTLRRTKSRRHHFIFGRRGSGKSSLLEKAVVDLTLERHPVVKVDLEAFKGHSYPDVLLSVLIKTLDEFQEWLKTAAVNPSSNRWWRNLFGSSPKVAPLNKEQIDSLTAELSKKIEELNGLLYSPDESGVSTQSISSQEHAGGAAVEGGYSSAMGVSAKAGAFTTDTNSSQMMRSAQFKQEKISFLHRNILQYQKIFKRMAELSGGDCYLFLDDLYHIRRGDQASVVDYFHRIAKGNSLWLKVGTIRHRTSWYIHGDPPVGLKIGDDTDEINLDLTLEKYSIAKEFLFKILQKFTDPKSIAVEEVITDGACDRLVLASGGVARDFLNIFRKSVMVARERSGDARGDKVTGEDVNNAAGEYDSTKQEEYKTDADAQKPLDAEFERIRKFCVDDIKSNCFLVDLDSKSSELEQINELVDLKLLHSVRNRVTVRDYPREIFRAYMLDLSQYTGHRKKRGLEIIEFWKKGAEDSLRRSKLILIRPEVG